MKDDLKNTPPNDKKIATYQRLLSDLSTRMMWAKNLGISYGGDRKLYQALGYPDEKDLDFDWYFAKYQRQGIASSIIDRPSNATWSGDIAVVKEGDIEKDSKLNDEWNELNDLLGVKIRLNKVDKLTGLGEYALLIFGFSDVKNKDGWKEPANGTLELKYLKQVGQSQIQIKVWENNAGNPRYGLPKIYEIAFGVAGSSGLQQRLVHHSRVLHVVEGSLSSEVFGRPRLKPIVNRLVDLEKLLGGDAEMFWRGARPGYTAVPKDDFEMDTEAEEALFDELDNYEHDLRRFITAQGVDIKALEQQVADPKNHVLIQLQDIAAQQGIPLRILMGNEIGQLASTQDKDQWLSLVQDRMKEFAEPVIFRPFIDRCMKHGILTKVDKYDVIWDDIFAPSEKDRVEIGAKRAAAVKIYSDSLFASEILPPQLVGKYLLGMIDEQIVEVAEAVQQAANEEDEAERLLREIERGSNGSVTQPTSVPSNGNN